MTIKHIFSALAVATLTIPVLASDAPAPGTTFGLDLYQGRSDLNDYKNYNDGMWAGIAPLFPSNVYIKWTTEDGVTAKAALGTGDLHNDKKYVLDRFPELWLSKEINGITWTLGKTWVPFAIGEWEWESKPGAKADWSKDALSVSAAATYNEPMKAGNYYMRLGYALSPEVSVGVSGASGKGWTFNTVHDSGYGLDATATYQGVKALAEYVKATHKSGDFEFQFAKLIWDRDAKLKPYVAAYRFDDKSAAFRYRGSVVGLDYKLHEFAAIESGYTWHNSGNNYWVQLHLTWEK